MSTEEPINVGVESSSPSEDEWLLDKAVELFNEGDYEEADLLCRQVKDRHGLLAADAELFIERIERRVEETMLERAVRLYQLGRAEEARLLFQFLASRGGPLAARARGYLADFASGKTPEDAPGWASGGAEAPPASAGFEPVIPPIKPDLPSFSEAPVWDEEAEGTPSAQPSPAPGAPPPPPQYPPPEYHEANVPRTEPPREVIIRRTPHMDIAPDSEVRPGSKLDVSVFVDSKGERPGEKSDDVTFEAAPGISVFKTQVRLLATPHFIIDDENVKNIDIYRDNPRSDTAEFKVVVKTAAELASENGHSAAGLTAVFAYGGRVSGRVSRKVPIVGEKSAPEANAAPEIPEEENVSEAKGAKERIRIDAVAQPADLTVEIISTPANDGRHFWCTVRTPLLPEYKEGVSEEWNLPDVASSIVGGYMTEFTTKGMSKEQRLASLKGAGRKLFEASPGVFQRAFWKLIDASLPFKTISIVSEEPYIPWELMIPRRKVDGLSSSRSALGVEFVIGRWIPKHAVSGRQRLLMTDCYVIAPNYVDQRALKYAQDESAFLIKTFPAPAGHSVKPADFNNITAAFEAGGKTIVHFACHGAVTNGKQVILSQRTDHP